MLAKDVPFKFDDACLNSFNILKEALISAPIIQPPYINNPMPTSKLITFKPSLLSIARVLSFS
jgi:hypothetical protein